MVKKTLSGRPATYRPPLKGLRYGWCAQNIVQIGNHLIVQTKLLCQITEIGAFCRCIDLDRKKRGRIDLGGRLRIGDLCRQCIEIKRCRRFLGDKIPGLIIGACIPELV